MVGKFATRDGCERRGDPRSQSARTCAVDGSIRNAYTVRFSNMAPERRRFAAGDVGPAGARIEIVGEGRTPQGVQTLDVGPDQTREARAARLSGGAKLNPKASPARLRADRTRRARPSPPPRTFSATVSDRCRPYAVRWGRPIARRKRASASSPASMFFCMLVAFFGVVAAVNGVDDRSRARNLPRRGHADSLTSRASRTIDDIARRASRTRATGRWTAACAATAGRALIERRARDAGGAAITGLQVEAILARRPTRRAIIRSSSISRRRRLSRRDRTRSGRVGPRTDGVARRREAVPVARTGSASSEESFAC